MNYVMGVFPYHVLMIFFCNPRLLFICLELMIIHVPQNRYRNEKVLHNMGQH